MLPYSMSHSHSEAQGGLRWTISARIVRFQLWYSGIIFRETVFLRMLTSAVNFSYDHQRYDGENDLMPLSVHPYLEGCDKAKVYIFALSS